MLTLLQSMYRHAKSCVRISRDKTTNLFPCQKGVRQGCPLSPLLFNLFTSGLETELKRNKACVEMYNTSVDLLMYADDIVLLSNNQSGLQKHLNTLELFCQNWKLDLNIDKTKVCVFGKRTCTGQFHWKGQCLEIVILLSWNLPFIKWEVQ